MPDIVITPSSGNIRFSQLTTDNSANIALSSNNLIISSVSGTLALSGLNGVTNNGVPISISGHNHLASDITNFSSAVSGLIPITDIITGSGGNGVANTGGGGGGSGRNGGTGGLGGSGIVIIRYLLV